MTEREWHACEDPLAMFRKLRCRFMHRKLRLFAVACCRCNCHYFTDQRSTHAIEVAEQHADGKVSDSELRRAFEGAYAVHAEAFAIHGKEGACVEWGAANVAEPSAFTAAKNASWMSATRRNATALPGADFAIQGNLVRDIFGNPFRPVTLDSRWLSSTVLDLARTIYDERLFDRMPILADALMDAGCDNKEILNHCRENGPHVRGCWVVDLLLGKE